MHKVPQSKSKYQVWRLPHNKEQHCWDTHASYWFVIVSLLKLPGFNFGHSPHHGTTQPPCKISNITVINGQSMEQRDSTRPHSMRSCCHNWEQQGNNKWCMWNTRSVRKTPWRTFSVHNMTELKLGCYSVVEVAIGQYAHKIGGYAVSSVQRLIFCSSSNDTLL